MHKRHFFILILLGLICLQTQAQLTISPYSRYGVGEIIAASSVRNTSMGGLGIGITDWGTINRLNPASYTDLRLSTLEVSAFGDLRNQRTDASSNNSFSGGYQNVAFGFPSNKSFSFIMGLAPYSSSEYDMLVRDTLPIAGVDEPYLQIYNASGGLNQFYAGLAFKLFRKVSLGANLAWTFGSLDKSWITAFEKPDYRPVTSATEVEVGGLRVTAGIQYEDTLGFKRKVDLLKENNNLIDALKESKDDLIKDEAEIVSEKAKLAKKRRVLGREKEIFEANRTQASAKVSALRAANASEGEINRAEADNRKYSRKIKKIDLGLNISQREIQKEERILVRKRQSYDKIIKRLSDKVAEIERDSSKRYEIRKDHLLFRFGAIVEPGSNLNGDHLLRFSNYNGVDGVQDTLFTEEGAIYIPLKYGLGLSIGRPGKWVAGVDLTMQNWESFKFFSETNSLGSSMKVNVGGELIPEKFSMKFYKRVAWRMGGYYETTGLNFSGTSINEFGVTVGMGIPMRLADRQAKVFSRINLGLTWAKRGTSSGGLLQENILKMSLGVNLNERMFRTRKID